MLLPSNIITPVLWARATRQPKHIIRMAARFQANRRLDPNSWATLIRAARFYTAIKEPALAAQYHAHAVIARRRNRVLASFAGSGPPTHQSSPMPSQWTIDGRTFTITLARNNKRTTIVELPSPNSNDIHATHSLYHKEDTNTFLFLRGLPTNWPTAHLITPRHS